MTGEEQANTISSHWPLVHSRSARRIASRSKEDLANHDMHAKRATVASTKSSVKTAQDKMGSACKPRMIAPQVACRVDVGVHVFASADARSPSPLVLLPEDSIVCREVRAERLVPAFPSFARKAGWEVGRDRRLVMTAGTGGLQRGAAKRQFVLSSTRRAGTAGLAEAKGGGSCA